jgi:hypothetical protein
MYHAQVSLYHDGIIRISCNHHTAIAKISIQKRRRKCIYKPEDPYSKRTTSRTLQPQTPMSVLIQRYQRKRARKKRIEIQRDQFYLIFEVDEKSVSNHNPLCQRALSSPSTVRLNYRKVNLHYIAARSNYQKPYRDNHTLITYPQ